MSAELTLDDDVKKDGRRCGFCLVEYSHIEEPRQLPCNHIFCLECLISPKKDEHKCPVCGSTFLGDVNYHNLPQPAAQCDASVSTDSLREVSDCCQEGNIPIHYCGECDDRICDDCVVAHNAYFKKGHKVMSLIEHRQQTRASGETRCHLHTGSSLSLTVVCTLCHQMFCQKCDLSDRCYVSLASNQPKTLAGPNVEHKCQTVEMYVRDRKERLNDKMETATALLQECCQQEKKMWLDYDSLHTSLADMLGELSAITRQRILHIHREHDLMKTEIEETFKCEVDKVEKMATELLADRVQIEERVAALTLEMRHCSDIQIIGNYNDNQTQIDSLLTGARELLESSANMSHKNFALEYTGFDKTGDQENTVKLTTLPTALAPNGTRYWENPVNYVSHDHDDFLVCSESGVYHGCYDSYLCNVQSYSLCDVQSYAAKRSGETVFAIISSELEKTFYARTVVSFELNYPEETMREDLFELSPCAVSDISVSEEFVVVCYAHPTPRYKQFQASLDEKENSQGKRTLKVEKKKLESAPTEGVAVYNRSTRQVSYLPLPQTITPATEVPLGFNFIDVSLDAELCKYSLTYDLKSNTYTLDLLWKYPDILFAAADTNGIIYAIPKLQEVDEFDDGDNDDNCSWYTESTYDSDFEQIYEIDKNGNVFPAMLGVPTVNNSEESEDESPSNEAEKDEDYNPDEIVGDLCIGDLFQPVAKMYDEDNAPSESLEQETGHLIILSSQGKLLTKLQCKEIPLTPLGISVRNEQVAIVDSEDGVMLYKPVWKYDEEDSGEVVPMMFDD